MRDLGPIFYCQTSSALQALYTGQRLGDLAALRWSNIDSARGEIRFVTAKTGRRMIIPLSDGLRTHIASLVPSDQTDAIIHPRAFAILEAHGIASMLSSSSGNCFRSRITCRCSPPEDRQNALRPADFACALAPFSAPDRRDSAP